MSEVLTCCLLCQSERLARDDYASASLALSSDHAVVRCADCSFRFLSPRPDAAEYAAAYAHGTGSIIDEYGALDSFYVNTDELRRDQYEHRLAALAERVPPGSRLLEIGASSGRFLSLAQARGFEVCGIEPSEQARLYARTQYGLELLETSVDQVDFEVATFDVVTSSHVFEHLLDPLAVATKVAHWLKPGGLHVMEVPNQWDTLGSLLRRHRLRRSAPGQRSITSIHHTVFFSRNTVRSLAERSGLVPESVRNVWYDSAGSFPSAAKRVIATAYGGSAFIELTARKRRS